MTQLSQSKHEPLARACAELVGDEIENYPHGNIQIVEHGNRLGIIWEQFSDYLDDKNLAGRVLDAVRTYGHFAPSWRYDNRRAFLEEVFDDTPKALFDLLKAAGLINEDS